MGWVKLYKAEVVDCIDGALVRNNKDYYFKTEKIVVEDIESDIKGISLERHIMAENLKENSSDAMGTHLAEEKDHFPENKRDANIEDDEDKIETEQIEPPRIHLGDSSLNDSSKDSYQLLPSEKAIKVHYIGYPRAEDRWLLLTGQLGDSCNK
eukprot:4387513-Ditylum_brightwellii.AAC.1